MPATLGNPAPAGALQTTPVSVGTTTREAQLPPLPPTPPFLMYAHPNRWMLVRTDDAWELLPSLAEIPVEPGVAGTDHRGDPSVGIAARTTKRGWTLVPEAAARPQDTMDGQPGYCRGIRGRQGAFHTSAWTGVRVVGNQPRYKPDLPRYYAWLRSLIDRRIVPGPDEAVIEAMLDQHREKLDRAGARDLVNNDYARRLYETAAAQVEALEALLAEATGLDDEAGVELQADAVQVEPAKAPTSRRSKSKGAS